MRGLLSRRFCILQELPKWLIKYNRFQLERMRLVSKSPVPLDLNVVISLM